jgi:hypothetical protein
MAEKNGGPAFPQKWGADDSAPIGPDNPRPQGMSLRDYFAAHASEDDIGAHRQREHSGERARLIPSREAARYRYADAMLAARDTQKEEQP